MRKFKVQYSQVFEYEQESVDLDAAARAVLTQVQPDEKGYIKIISIEEVGSSRATACPDCLATELKPSRILNHWPRVAKKG